MSEELKGQLAEALPGAVGIFAEALYGKDPDGEAKLFKAMEKGQVKLEELVKVIDHMKTLSREDLIKKMLDSPAKKMEKMRTAWSRLLTEINSSFMIDTFATVFDKMADELSKLRVWFQENKKDIDLWVNRTKHLIGALWDLKEVLIALYVANKLFKIGGVAGGLWGWLTKVPVLPPAPLSVRILNFLKSGLRLALRAWPVLAGAFIWDLIETLQGKTTMLSEWASSDNPFIAFLAKIPILLGEAVANLEIGGLLLYGWIKAALFGDESDKKVVREAASMWATDMMNIIDKWGLRPSYEFFQESIRRFGYLGAALAGAMTGDLSKTTMNLGMFTHSIQTFGFDTKTHQAALAEMRNQENSAANLKWIQNYQPFSTTNPSFMLPRQQGVGNQTINLTINAEGTPDAIKSVATQAFADMMSSSILGVSANYQGGK